MATGQQLHVLRGHTDVVWSVTVTRDCLYIVGASSDNNLIVWSFATGKQLRVLQGR